ncbi:mechanosensitive ion channel family protein [Thermostichus sp. MS-CIW-34]|jgi:small conductance mechanosensitive channel
MLIMAQDIYAFHPDPPAVAESAGLPGGLAKGAAATTLVLLGSLAGLASVGVNIGPLVASLGFIGLGISLAAQDLIKDVINGLLILIEDQFAEGDVIVVDGRGGLVEHMDLRVTYSHH